MLPGYGRSLADWKLQTPSAAPTPPTYHLLTMGCQMNVADSERMAGALEDLGYVHTEAKDEASLLVCPMAAVLSMAKTT